MPRFPYAKKLLRQSQVGLAFCCFILGAHAEPESPAYLYGTPTGCLVWLTSPLSASESLRWSGGCDKEFANGEGELSIIEQGQRKHASTGVMALGFPVGAWADSASVSQVQDKTANVQQEPASVPKMPATVVFFDFGSAQLTEQARRKLQDFSIQLATASSDTRFRIVGHADARGTRKSIDQISKARADAVQAYLIEKGVAPNRLAVEARGDTIPANPAVPFSPENRRVSLEPVSGL